MRSTNCDHIFFRNMSITQGFLEFPGMGVENSFIQKITSWIHESIVLWFELIKLRKSISKFSTNCNNIKFVKGISISKVLWLRFSAYTVTKPSEAGILLPVFYKWRNWRWTQVHSASCRLNWNAVISCYLESLKRKGL